jgi:hypothetical protein
MTRRLLILADRAIIAGARLPGIVLIMGLVLVMQLLCNVAVVASEAWVQRGGTLSAEADAHP